MPLEASLRGCIGLVDFYRSILPSESIKSLSISSACYLKYRRTSYALNFSALLKALLYSPRLSFLKIFFRFLIRLTVRAPLETSRLYGADSPRKTFRLRARCEARASIARLLNPKIYSPLNFKGRVHTVLIKMSAYKRK